MAKWYAYGPMSVFAYQVYLAFTGRDPLTVYGVIRSFLFTNVAPTLHMVFG